MVGLRRGRRRFRLVALIALAGGLLFFQLHAKTRELPLIRIGEISPLLNFSSVRVQGTLESDARRRRDGSALYRVTDGSGTLSVFVSQPPAGKLPKAGSRITVSGSLSVGAGNEIRMRVCSAEQVVVEARSGVDAFISEFKLSDLSSDHEGARMTIYGRVSKLWKPKPGSKAPHKIVLEDASGSLDIVHWLKPVPTVEVGDELAVKGSVERYKGRLQLRVWSAEDIQPFAEEPDAPVFLDVSAISAEMEGQWVEVEGVLGEPRSIPGGVIYPLDDGAGIILALFWDRNIKGEERDALDEGVRVRITAPVVVYKEKLELVPKDLGGFQILK